MNPLQGGIAVITGAASGLGLEAARIAAGLSMRVVMADVQAEALAAACAEVAGLGAAVLPFRLDVARAAEVAALAAATVERFGTPNLVFNNAGVGAGGLVWEQTLADWDWVLGVNLMGVVHGVREFTPRMLAAAAADPGWHGHIVNTASMAGLVNMPNMGAYNVTKHAVVSLTETLYQDLALVTTQLRAHLLCPFFVPTGIAHSQRNRPPEPADAGSAATRSQQVAQAMMAKAVSNSRVSAAQVAQSVFEACAADRFYIHSHPGSLGGVQTRLEDIVALRNPGDPFRDRPELGEQLRAALKAGPAR
jgi:NAD(P)-dependent dehydrogenase (short-subunit alcohol dehydrogenase family)